MVGARGFVENVLDARFVERSVQLLEAGAQALGLRSANAEPQQMHALGKRGGIGEDAVVIRFGIEFAIAEDEHPPAPLNPPMYEKRSRWSSVI